MRTWSTLAAASLLASLTGNLTAMAQVPDAASAALPDSLCDYCKDFTDQATAAAPVRSTYLPGRGYISQPQSQLGSVRPVERQELEPRLIEDALGATPK